MPFALSVTVEAVMSTFSTVLSSLPPTDPMERPWLPEQVPPVKVMSVPELMAMQSSWFCEEWSEIVILRCTTMGEYLDVCIGDGDGGTVANVETVSIGGQ